MRSFPAEYEDEDYYRTQVTAHKDVCLQQCSLCHIVIIGYNPHSDFILEMLRVVQDGQEVSADIYVWKEHLR